MALQQLLRLPEKARVRDSPQLKLLTVRQTLRLRQKQHRLVLLRLPPTEKFPSTIS